MSITGEPDGQPIKVGVAIADIMTGMFACNAILAALHSRAQTGLGQHIDISLFDSQLAWLANVGQNVLVSGNDAKRYGNAHANIVPYQTFAASDGWVALAVGNDSQFKKFCEAADCLELASDPRYATNPARVENRVALTEKLSAIFAQDTRAVWLALLEQAKIPHGAINTVAGALSHPQAVARGMVQSVPHPTAGEIKLVAPPVKFSSTPAQIRRHPPLLGEHTDEVLRELGFGEGDLVRLREVGAV